MADIKHAQEVIVRVFRQDGQALAAIESPQGLLVRAFDEEHEALKVVIDPDSELAQRIKAMEDAYVRATWFESIDSQTGGVGAIPLPGTSAQFVMDEWPDGTDAVVCPLGTDSRPDFQPAYDAGGNEITVTLFNADGSYSLSHAPVGACAFVFRYRIRRKYSDDALALGDFDLDSAGGDHVLATTTGLGSKHTVTGLTAGQVLKATGADTAAFAALQAADLPSIDHGGLAGLTDDDHAQYHDDTRAGTWHGGLSGAHVTGGDGHDHYGGDGAQIDHTHLANIGANTHAQIDTHLASVANPHAVTGTQVGLGNVTNDAQLKRAAGDMTGFSAKIAPIAGDIMLLEDSADSYSKKKVTIADLPAGMPMAGMRNKIINGAMEIDQRNAGTALIVNDSTAFYPVDRWYGAGQAADGVYTVQRSTDVPAGFVYSTKVTVTTADASITANQYYFFAQIIEGVNCVDLAFGNASAKTVTLSFWIKSSITGTFSGSLRNGAANRSYPFTYVINIANTWEYKSVTITGDTIGTWLVDTGKASSLSFSLGIGSTYTGPANTWAAANYLAATGSQNLMGTLNATWLITGVQLEIGLIATTFEHRPFTTEMALCQRYYWKTFPLATAPAGAAGTTGALSSFVYIAGAGNYTCLQVFYPVLMRAAGTPIFFNTANTGATWRDTVSNTDLAAGALIIGDSGFSVYGTQTENDAAGNHLHIHATVDAEL